MHINYFSCYTSREHKLMGPFAETSGFFVRA